MQIVNGGEFLAGAQGSPGGPRGPRGAQGHVPPDWGDVPPDLGDVPPDWGDVPPDLGTCPRLGHVGVVLIGYHTIKLIQPRYPHTHSKLIRNNNANTR